ncbi:MAG: alanine racemase [Parvularculaceae bacterium]
MTQPLRPQLHVDLAALKRNYTSLATIRPEATTASVVKADAYGLGVARIAPALYEAGCRIFYVAYGFEGAALREMVGAAAEIIVLSGPFENDLEQFTQADLTPVLNTPAQVTLWAGQARARCQLHIDTGMNRLGMSPQEALALLDQPGLTQSLNVTALISHFACAATPGKAMNKKQIDQFTDICIALGAIWPDAKTSLSASAGLFLEMAADETLVRPGISLYGSSPQEHPQEILATVATLSAPVLQLRALKKGEAVGYGSTYKPTAPTRIATLGIGYGDGLPRALGNKGQVILHRTPCPIVGTVSMDMISVDVSDVRADISIGDRVEIFGASNAIEEVARTAGTISYDLLAKLTPRVLRVYG